MTDQTCSLILSLFFISRIPRGLIDNLNLELDNTDSKPTIKRVRPIPFTCISLNAECAYAIIPINVKEEKREKLKHT